MYCCRFSNQLRNKTIVNTETEHKSKVSLCHAFNSLQRNRTIYTQQKSVSKEITHKAHTGSLNTFLEIRR